MLTEININCDGNWDKPEVQLSGSADTLTNFGRFLNQVEETQYIATHALKNEFYTVALQNLVIEPTTVGNDRLTVEINDSSLKLSGTRLAFNKLADSLINFFDDDSEIGDHFHLDYYEGNQVLNETNCHLVFIRDQ